MWWAHSRDEAGGTGQKGEGNGKKAEKTQKVRKAGREAGHRLETATICSVALGLRSGWRWQSWRPSPPPRPVPSATRARPWPVRPAPPGPRGPGGGWAAALPPEEGPGRSGVGWGRAKGKSGCDPQVSRAGGSVRPLAGYVAAGGGAPAGAGPGAGCSRGEAPRAPGGRRIAKRCGLAKIAEPRRERAQEGGI